LEAKQSKYHHPSMGETSAWHDNLPDGRPVTGDQRLVTPAAGPGSCCVVHAVACRQQSQRWTMYLILVIYLIANCMGMENMLFLKSRHFWGKGGPQTPRQARTYDARERPPVSPVFRVPPTFKPLAPSLPVLYT